MQRKALQEAAIASPPSVSNFSIAGTATRVLSFDLMHSRLFLITCLVLAAHSQQSPRSPVVGSPPGSADTRIPLSLEANGINGELQIVQDARLTPSLKDQLWGSGDLLAGTDPQSRALKENPFRNAVVQLVRADGTPVQSEQLERPLARLARTHLYSDTRETYLLAVDYSAGFGSYSGPATSLLEVRSGRLSWLEATDNSTGKTQRISLANTLKSVWKIVPARSGSGKDILQALCRPSTVLSTVPSTVKDEVEFRLIYIRYFYDGKKWSQRTREVKGFSEFEDGFPDPTLFP